MLPILVIVIIWQSKSVTITLPSKLYTRFAQQKICSEKIIDFCTSERTLNVCVYIYNVGNTA